MVCNKSEQFIQNVLGGLVSEKVEVHISDIRSFRQCRRKWYWSSRLGKNLEPAIPYAPFFTGKAIHAALEFYYVDNVRPEDTIDKYLDSEQEYLDRLAGLWPLERKKLDDEIHTVRMLIDHYFLWQENDDLSYSDKNLEFIEMERAWEFPIEIPLRSGEKIDAILAGRFDGFCRHMPSNRYFVFETKTARSVESFSHTLATDQQCTLYQYAAERTYDVPVAGTLFNIMSKSEPKYPTLTKTGRMSKNKRISTTWFYYVRALRETLGLSNAEIRKGYGDILAELRKHTTKFFKRLPIERSSHQMDSALEGLLETASEMLDPNTKLYASPSWMNCNFCLFKGPCIAKDMGGNYESLLQHEFNLRTGHESMRQENNE
jgi:hypothetical protein